MKKVKTQHMKKLFVILAAGLFLFAACEPAPVLSVSPTEFEVGADGGSQTIAITANSVWYVRDDMRGGNFFCTVTPTEGTGNGFITITAVPNTTGEFRGQTIAVTCESRGESVTQKIMVHQLCPAGSASLKVDEIVDADGKKVPAAGGLIKMTVTANAPWTLSCEESDVKLSATSGDNGSTAVVATVPANPGLEDRGINFKLSCKTAAGGVDISSVVGQAGGLVYAGETYKVKKMKDGKWWMTENLRYVPEGMTPSDDLSAVTAGVFYPLVLNADHTALAFSKDADVIKANGYLYQAEVALGLKVGDLTSVEAAEALNGTRGICPEGWHVPTGDDIINLVGKAVSPLTPNTEAPYYDGNNGSIALLNADGFNMDAFGAISIQDNTKTAGSFMGWAKAYPDKISSGMFCGSTYAGVTYNTKDDPTSGVKNLQFFGFMPMTNKATEAEYTCNGSKVSYRIAGPLRCVKDNN